ncbi:MAG: DUF3500 domain-containing protein [Akkermansiaceae bacterium]|nr:DUF3500 domain-containing protein [Akkermansiaceae bacterium]MDP4996960.1 DUF3500 domain-containing protein [Akkermansiaceae bacterium]
MKKFLLLGLLSILPVCAQQPADLEKVAAEMADAANAFLTSLDEDEAKKARFPFTPDERENWNFVPTKRNGIPLEELTEEQTDLARKLLKTALSDPGLTKVDAIIALEAFLGEIEKRPELRNPKAYFTSIFGEPSATGTWGWRFEGHHLSLNYTIVDGKPASLTPSFFAANPAEVTAEHAMKGTRPLAAEEDLARALAATLAESGKAVVFTEKPPKDILSGSSRKIEQLDPVGIPATEMTAAQQQALLTLIAEYAERHRKELSDATMEEIKADLENLRFAWAGSLERGKPFYYRIQSTTFLVEVANVQNNGNHIHAVWRDTENDFGNDILSDHIHKDH